MSDEAEALIHPGDDGKFWAEVVGVNGCYAQGDNYSKIMANLRDAHELCSTAQALPAPPPSAIELGEGATVADLQAQLAPHGWAPGNEMSTANQLLSHGETGSKLCVPASQTELLNVGFRAAVTGYLAGS